MASCTLQDNITSTASFHVGAKQRHERNSPSTSNAPRVLVCAFCKGQHWHSDCVKVPDNDRRRDIVRRDRLCYNCLRRHNVRDCLAKGRCRNCKQKHHTALCSNDSHVRPVDTSLSSDSKQISSGENPCHVKLTPTCISPTGPVLLKTATGTISTDSTNNNVTVNILLDEGAQRTFITQRTVTKLDISHENCVSENITLATFGADNHNEKRVNVVSIKLNTISGANVCLSAIVVPQISSLVRNHVQKTVLKHSYLKVLPLTNHVAADDFEIDLLIGADYYWDIVENNTVRGPGPTAVASKLGYLLSGPSNLNDVSVLNTMIYTTMMSPAPDDQKLTDYWELETVDIKDEPNVNKYDFERYRDTNLHLSDGKYTAKLPWKNDHPSLPTNFNICDKRTRSMAKRLSDDQRQIYDQVLSDHLSRGFIEPVPHDDHTRGHYIPHHAVHKESPTTPIRIVYDCSCKQGDNPSLNDCLEIGPTLINNLVEILLRFRLHTIAFTSDIEKAFLNVKLDEHDRNFTKFLWLSDPNDPDSEFVVYRFTAVLFGAASSPFILNAVLKTHLEHIPSDITRDMKDNIYVDNLISGSKTVSESITYYQDSTSILQQGGFRLRSWATNNSQLNDIITQDDHDCHESKCTVKILGMIWNTQLDLLSYPSYSHSSDLYTKREIVRLTSSLFDPLGYLSPVHISAKIFIQKLWQLNLEWDKPLNEELVDEWKIIHGELDSIRKITIQRPYFSNDINSNELSHELHVFADASPKAYGVVVYLKHGSTTAFVMSKSRVKPLKDITLPRMELLATFIATRLSQFILKSFSRVNIQKVVLWSDSQIVLHWIKGDKKLPMFVENRVKVIRDASFSDIKYCPTKDNPADLLTRGISSLELQQSTLWTCGPSWLPNGDWPICDLFDSAVLACYIEPCEHDIIDPSIIVNTLHSDTVSVVSGIDNVIDITRFPSLGKLLRVTSYVLRFINRLKHCITLSECKPYITVTELQIAQNKWIKAIQSTTYPRELKSLQNKSGEKLSLVQQLKLFMGNDGLLRCGGRFQHANVVFSAKYPILIPRRHYFTELDTTHWSGIYDYQYQTILLDPTNTTGCEIYHTEMCYVSESHWKTISEARDTSIAEV